VSWRKRGRGPRNVGLRKTERGIGNAGWRSEIPEGEM
jgi:hypothetical protein